MHITPKRARALLIALAVFSASVLLAADGEAEKGNRDLAKAFEAAWNSHDMDAFGRLLTDDVDWVNVDGYRGRGRDVVQQGHVRVHATKFKDSVITVQSTETALLSPTIAIVHVKWGMRGDRNNDGTERKPREGLFTWVTIKDSDGWRIRASHNSNLGTIK